MSISQLLVPNNFSLFISNSTVTSKSASVAATTTLTSANSGEIISLITNAGAVTLNLPALQAGLNFNIFVQHALANAVTIKSPSAVINGNVLSNDGTPIATITNKTNVILGTTSVIGDWFDITCDGTLYYIVGATSVHGSVTTS